MYWRHFNLSAEPFSLTPDPAFLYLSSVHAEAYAALMVGLRERRGLIAMIGEVGTGKTTLIYSLLSQLGPEIHTAYISNARLSFDGILRSALRDFGIECESVHSSDLLEAFNRFLHQCAEEGSTAALVIDEAQNLSRDTFEDLRLLTNFETYKHKLLQIVLVGQPELDSKLRDPALRQVADRIAVRCHVNPLTPQEVRQYIQHRLSAAGGTIEIFSETGLRLLVSHSRGIPRSINILGHNAMLFAYGAGRHSVTRGDVRAAVQEREGRGLVRFEPRLPSWMTRKSPGAEPRSWSYPQLLIAGVAAGLVLFALGASGAKLLAARSTHEAHPAAGVESSRDSATVEHAGAASASSQPPAVEHGDAEVVSPNASHDRAAHAPASSAQPAASARDASTASAEAAAVAPQPAAAPAAPAQAPVVEDAPAEVVQPSDEVLDRRHEPSAVPAPHGAAESEPELESAHTAPTPEPHAAVTPTPAVQPPVLAAAPEPGQHTRAVATLPPDSPASIVDQGRIGPELVRVIQVSRGSSLYELMTDIYGSYDPRYVPRIQAMNPQVKDPNYIIAGDELRFPEDLGDQVRSGR